LEEIQVRPSDRIVFVGDLITKGPADREVLDFVRATRRCQSVLGNHEYDLLRFWQRQDITLSRSQLQTVAGLGKSFDGYMEWVAGFPGAIDLGDQLVVHAGLRPGVSLEQQTVEDLTGIRTWGDSDAPWFDQYEGKTAVFGHWVFAAPHVSKSAIGIDTGCVYGGSLTAVILPERRLVSIPAVKSYSRKEERSAGQHENVRKASLSRPSLHS
jgi:hypothetical protein